MNTVSGRAEFFFFFARDKEEQTGEKVKPGDDGGGLHRRRGVAGETVYRACARFSRVVEALWLNELFFNEAAL